MSYTRREVKDHVTVMNKDLYDNLQDGIDEAKDEIIQVDIKSETAMSIAKGKNRAHVFSTTKAMMSWLSDVNNKGLYNIGDNLYIVDIDVPDWWISEVLTEQDIETGFYYKIAQLEGQKVDLTEIMADLNSLGEKTEEIEDSLIELGGFTPIIDLATGKITGYTTTVGGADTVFPFSSVDFDYVVLDCNSLRTDGEYMHAYSINSNTTEVLPNTYPLSKYKYCYIYSQSTTGSSEPITITIGSHKESFTNATLKTYLDISDVTEDGSISIYNGSSWCGRYVYNIVLTNTKPDDLTS